MPSPHLETPGAWVTSPNPRGMSPMSGLTINGSCVRTQFYWVLHQNPNFLDPMNLNIIVVNKIINKFERKYYYYY